VANDRAEVTAVLGRLFEEHNPRVVRYLWRLTGDRAVAEQLAQTAWLEFGVAKYADGSGAVPASDDMALVFRIARCRAADWWRTRTRQAEVVFSAFDDEVMQRVLQEGGPGVGRLLCKAQEESGEIATRRMDVHAALMGLPSRQRQATVLHYLLELTIEEVAALMGTSVNTVRAHLRVARTALRGQPALLGYAEGRSHG
ncbi:MAG TPA: RNA polymerase sigma factor, partial [Micromonosporaceae bacterium]|nr:RNA polymerase sigma factor [Micromonosporaceae bacterium]